MYYHFAILLIEISTLLQFLISFTDGKIFIKKSSLYILKHSPRHNNNNFYALKPQVAKNEPDKSQSRGRKYSIRSVRFSVVDLRS